MYKLVVESRVEKELDAIPTKLLKRIDEHVLSLSQNPRPLGCKKLVGQKGYRVRVGGYRILYTVDDKKKIVCIYRVKARKVAYR